MTVYVALLRGINVSGHNKVAMADLRQLFESLPAEDVSTYVQSGNVIFRRTGRQSEAGLRETIERRIADVFGLTVTVVLRTADELQRVVTVNPLLGESRDPSKLHVAFLTEVADSARVERIDPSVGGSDEFVVMGREVYLHCPNGYGTSKLNNAFFERRLGRAATTRNWKTVTTLSHLARQAEDG